MKSFVLVVTILWVGAAIAASPSQVKVQASLAEMQQMYNDIYSKALDHMRKEIKEHKKMHHVPLQPKKIIVAPHSHSHSHSLSHDHEHDGYVFHPRHRYLRRYHNPRHYHPHRRYSADYEDYLRWKSYQDHRRYHHHGHYDDEDYDRYHSHYHHHPYHHRHHHHRRQKQPPITLNLYQQPPSPTQPTIAYPQAIPIAPPPSPPIVLTSLPTPQEVKLPNTNTDKQQYYALVPAHH